MRDLKMSNLQKDQESPSVNPSEKKYRIAFGHGPKGIKLNFKDLTFKELAKHCSVPKKGGKHEGWLLRGGDIVHTDNHITSKNNECGPGHYRSDKYLNTADFLIIDGDCSIDNPDSAPEPKKAHTGLKMLGLDHFLYTTYSHTEKINKFRAVIPCSMSSKEQLKATALKIIHDLNKLELPIKYVSEMGRWSQLWYLPTRDDPDDGLFEFYEHHDGHDYQAVDSFELPNDSEDGRIDKSGERKSQEDHIQAIISGDDFHSSLQSVISNHANNTPHKDTLIQIAQGLVARALLSDALDDKRTARAERMLSPDSTEIADMVDWSLSSNEAEEKAKKVYLDKCKDPMAELRRQYGVTEDDVKDIGEEKYVYGNLLIEGHILTLIGEAGSGKTALFVHLAPEFVKAGYTVNYINLDAPWNELPRLQQFAVDGGYTMLSPDVKKGGLSIEGLVEFIKQMSLLDNSLIGEVFIFDTLKRCVDMMSKGQLKEFYAMCRKLSARGATVVLLGHTNKKRDHDGNLIFEGTGDVRNDTDELLFLECKDDENENRFVSTYVDTNCGAKVRGKFKPMTFIIKKDRSVIKSLVYIDTKKAKKEELKIQKHRDLYDFIISYVKKHPGKSQGVITDAAKEAGHPKKTARDLLLTLSDVDSDKQCLYSRESKKHPYPIEYYTMEYAEGKISKGEKL